MSTSTGFIRGGSSNIAEADLINSSTGAGFVGTVSVLVTIDNGTQTAGTQNGGLATAKGNGLYQYYPSAAESDGTVCAFTFVGTGASPRTSQYWPISAAQSSAVATATGPGVKYVLTIIKNALFGLNVYGPSEPIKPADSDYCLSQLNNILDDWNADIQASYAETFLVFPSTGVNPETIGPSGTFAQNARPVSIDGVSYDLGGGVYKRIFTTMDPNWWDAQTLTTGGGVYGAYYEPSEPLGKLYFANVPSTATNIRLMLRTTLGPVALTDAMALPQGYESALTLTLQEHIAETFNRDVSPSLMARAGKARGRIFANNLRNPTLSARGQGLPGMTRRRWDYKTGTWF